MTILTGVAFENICFRKAEYDLVDLLDLYLVSVHAASDVPFWEALDLFVRDRMVCHEAKMHFKGPDQEWYQC